MQCRLFAKRLYDSRVAANTMTHHFFVTVPTNSRFRFILAFLLWANCIVVLQAQISQMPLPYGSLGQMDAEMWFRRDIQQEVEKRIISLRKQFPESPVNDRATLLLADAQFRAGAENPDEYVHAWRTLDSFALTRPNSPLLPFAYELAAKRHLERENYAEAREYFVKSSASASENLVSRGDSAYKPLMADGLYWQGVCFLQESFTNPNFSDSAQAAFERTVSLYPRGLYADDALFLLARYAELRKQYDTALARYDRIIAEYPRGNVRLAAHLRAAQNHLQYRRAARALGELETAAIVFNNTKNTQQPSNQAPINQAPSNQSYEAQSYADNAREQILYIRGEANAAARRFDAALQSFTALLKEFPRSALTMRGRLGKGYALLNLADSSESGIDAALKEYDIVIEADDLTNPEYSRLAGVARLYRTICLKRKGDRETARKELSALAVQSDFLFPAEALLELGEMYYQEGKYDDARKTLERAAREAPDAATQMWVNLLLGETALEAKAYSLAVRSFERAEQLLAQVPLHELSNRDEYLAEAVLKRGIALVGAKEYRDAMTQFTRFLNDNPYLPDAPNNETVLNQRTEAAFWTVEAEYQAELLQNAVRGYQVFLSEYGTSGRAEEALYGLGWAQFRLRQFNESSATFTRLLREFPQSGFALDVLARKGDGLYITKNYRAAAESYRQAARLQPKSEQGEYAAFQLGQSLYRLQEYDQALEAMRDFAKSYSASPLADDALYGAAWISFQQRRFADAAKEFRALLDAYPQGSAAARSYYALGDSYFNLEQYDAAIQAYRAVADVFPLHPLAPEAVNAVQYCYLLQGKEDSASAVTDKYINASPGSTLSQEVKFKKAETLFNAGKFSSAAAEFEDFITKNRQNPRNAEAMYQIGRSYASVNDTTKAFAAFARVEKDYPQSNVAPRAALETALLRKEIALAKRPPAPPQPQRTAPQTNPRETAAQREARLAQAQREAQALNQTTTQAFMLAQAQSFAEADSAFARVERLYAGDDAAVRASFERALMREARGDTTGALRQYREVAERYKGSDYGDRCRYRVAMFFRQNALYDSARAQLEQIASSRTDELAAEAQYRIGEMYQREKKYAEAITAYLKNKNTFAGLEDWYTLALLNLGLCYEAGKDVESAKEIYRLVMAQHGEDDFAKTARERLEKLMKL
jgi:TolA-binding protein